MYSIMCCIPGLPKLYDKTSLSLLILFRLKMTPHCDSPDIIDTGF